MTSVTGALPPKVRSRLLGMAGVVSIVALWWIAADGSGRPESLLVSLGSHYPGSITPDGRATVFQELGIRCVLWIDRDTQDIVRRIVLEAAPTEEAREDPLPMARLLELEK